MSKAKNHPPASSVIALRIPIIKKGEYDLWCMKMRQYIAITDHILWEIITSGDQATTEAAPASDRHLLNFHDAQDAKTLWDAIKARFGGNEASKKMQKNLLKQQFVTFVSNEGANLKFLRSLPSEWHVVTTMTRGQPGLDALDFDDLYNNLKVTSKQSTADDIPEIITKGYAQASSSKLQDTLNPSSNSDEIICSFFAQQASMPETHDDEDLLQIDDDVMEEIDIRLQVAMITARIRKFMRKTGRPIDLKPKNGISFDKSKIECFNCQKLGEIEWTKEFGDEPVTFAMVALNGLGEDDRSMEIDAEHVDFGQDGLGDFDWSEEADNAPVALALMATSSTDSSNSEVPYCSKSYKKLLKDYQTERDNYQKARLEIQGYQLSLESLKIIIKTHEKNEYAWGDKYEQMEYDLNMRDWKLGEKQKELDKVIKERDELKDKLEKWSNATLLQTWDPDNEACGSQKKTVLESENSEKSSENRSPRTQDSFDQRSRRRGLGYREQKLCYVCYSPDHLIKDCDLHERNLRENLKPRPMGTNGPRDTRPVWNNTSRVNHRNFSSDYRYPHQRRSFIPSAVLTMEGLESTAQPTMLETRSYNTRTVHRSNSPKPIVKSKWVKKESTTGTQAGNLEEELKDHAIIDSGCFGSMPTLWNLSHFGGVTVESLNRKKYCLVVTDDCSRFSWVFFLAYKDETYDILHDLIVGLENKLRHKVKIIRCDHGTEFKNKLMNEFYAKKGIKREYSIARTPQQNGVAERKNRTLIEAARTMLADSLLPIQFWG
ncbi:ribonuclease H-like domain-containing protein [Tanacetum coccineum]